MKNEFYKNSIVLDISIQKPLNKRLILLFGLSTVLICVSDPIDYKRTFHISHDCRTGLLSPYFGDNLRPVQQQLLVAWSGICVLCQVVRFTQLVALPTPMKTKKPSCLSSPALFLQSNKCQNMLWNKKGWSNIT